MKKRQQKQQHKKIDAIEIHACGKHFILIQQSNLKIERIMTFFCFATTQSQIAEWISRAHTHTHRQWQRQNSRSACHSLRLRLYPLSLDLPDIFTRYVSWHYYCAVPITLPSATFFSSSSYLFLVCCPSICLFSFQIHSSRTYTFGSLLVRLFVVGAFCGFALNMHLSTSIRYYVCMWCVWVRLSHIFAMHFESMKRTRARAWRSNNKQQITI